MPVDFAQGDSPGNLATNVAQLRQWTGGAQSVDCAVRLEGIVAWRSTRNDRFILQDDSGAIPVAMDLRNEPALEPGQRVTLEGRGEAGYGVFWEVLIDNDGLHPPSEKSASIDLAVGQHPLRLDWFNGPELFALEFDYAGPDLPRQRIPDSVLFHAEKAAVGTNDFAPGLEYQCFEGNWSRLPEFRSLPSVRGGIATNFTLQARSRDEQVGLQFTGYLEVKRAGRYTFWLKSDDGSRLQLAGSGLRLCVQGTGSAPALRRIAGATTYPATEDEGRWVEADGKVTFVQFDPQGRLDMDLSSGTNRLRVEVEDAAGPAPLLFSRIRVRGICQAPESSQARRAERWLAVPALDEIEQLENQITDRPSLLISNLAQLRQIEATGQHAAWPVHLTGLVRAVDADLGLLAFQDDSGAALMEMDLRNCSLRPGDRIVLESYGLTEGARVRLRSPALVDNDGIHSAQEKSGSIFLSAGKYRLHVSWFNRDDPYALEVYWQGPGLRRQRIPGAVLFHRIASGPSALHRPSGARNQAFSVEVQGRGNPMDWSPGLQYRSYDGAWLRLPYTRPLEPVRQGITSNFQVDASSKTAGLDMEFDGFLETPQAGLYTFSTVSDDGSLLTIDEQPPRVQVVGNEALPDSVPVVAGQMLRDEQSFAWAQVEGTVNFAGSRAGELELEISSGTGRMRVEVVDGCDCSPQLLLHGRVKATGICQSTRTLDGQTVAGALVMLNSKELELLEIAPSAWADHPVISVAQARGWTGPSDADDLAHVRGKLRPRISSETLVLEDVTGAIPVEITHEMPRFGTGEVEVLGSLRRLGNNVVLRCGFFREIPDKTENPARTLPLLTTVDQVKRLSRAEAQRGYPVKIKGVITTVLDSGFFIQDATWGIYARRQPTADGDIPRVGDFWEVEGATFVEFAPNIMAQRAVRLGAGTLPEPLHPTWDQLINGSLDTQYVEVQGVVTSVEGDVLSLLTSAGSVSIQLSDVEPATLRRYENALIRVRGCVIPGRDARTQQVELGQLHLSNASVNLDEAAPEDPFSTARKSVSDLLLFDSRARDIQRVKIAGQILYERGGEVFLCEGTNGLRFFPRGPLQLQAGDLVEVVGFPKLGGPSPVLREALARRTGTAPLPEPKRLPAEGLLGRQYDSTRVRVEARLIIAGSDASGQTLELQAGTRGFVARLARKDGRLQDLKPGSRLELTGVYAGQGGDAAAGRDIDSFELLLNSAADVRVLERPSWWTFRHTFAALGALVTILLAALIWITLLRRQVEERSRQLSTEIRRHEHTERRRELEEERARIAQDLHDDLGATLTQIRLLSALESRDALVPETNRVRMKQVSEKSREMVASLDEIVWAVNPANDSLPSLATYLCFFAEEFFRPSSIRCRLDVDDRLPTAALTSEVRHHVYLAVREALNNIAKHSRATEVWLRIHSRESGVEISIEDNGCGFRVGTSESPSGEGLANMRRRVEKVGGRFDCESRPDAGTVCRMWLPVTPASNGHAEIGGAQVKSSI